ncbi:MAG: PP2C family protein-serine/threonine phosphatase [Actinomycetales bacterium]
MVALRYAARSDIGLGRRNNQDSAYAGVNLLVVADGMGGHAGGDIASSLAVGRLAVLDDDAPGADALQELEGAIHSAADGIRERVHDQPELAGMGTTVTGILRHGNRLALAHIGDSRAYLLRDGVLTQVTKDHTFVQTLVDDGKITAEEASQHPQRNIVMRVIGDVDAPEDVDTSVREAVVGDRWLLCSDGLSGPVSKDTLAETLAGVRDPAACAERLVDLALRAGGNDNITCIVADVVPEANVGASSTPQVVGAAALTRDQPTRAGNSAAAKAAALTRREPEPEPADEDYDIDDGQDEQSGRRLFTVLGALLVLAVIGGGLYGAWVWTQRQYYVGADQDNVAVFRGLSSDIGPITMSSVVETADTLPVDTLDPTSQERVRAGIGADDLADARRIVINLYQESSVCTPTVVVNPGSGSSSTGTGAGATTPTVQPTTNADTTPSTDTEPSAGAGSSTPTPSGNTTTLPVPDECGEA